VRWNLAALTCGEPEVYGRLVTLMETQASRLVGRTGPWGAPIALLDQNRGLWDLVN
jgi:predicted RNA polymerase sigma factor